MSAGSQDYWTEVGNPGSATTLSAPGHAIGGTAFTVVSTSNWATTTGAVFAVDTYTVQTVNGVATAVRTPGSYTEWEGVVSSSTSITGAVLRYGTDQIYPAGSTTRVYIPVASSRENRLAQGIQLFANQDATLKTSAVQAALGLTSLNGYTPLGATFSTVTANGNRSYSCVINGADYTNVLSPGMRLRTTRTVAAPTQSTSLNGTTQYYSKTTPAGMTFTDDFVVSAWIKVSSYALSGIASRYNGTSGWRLDLNASGQVELVGLNAGAGNVRYVQSYQSVPLNKWVHVTAQLDMSTNTATTTTSYVMIDGVDVPAQALQAGTNPVALIQAGNLEIGSYNAGNFFPGKIAQVAIYSAKVTQATILASMNQTLAGTETSLISAYSFNNTINDLNANANNLTANGSAVATNADSPFGGQAGGTISSTLDYGIIQSVAFSTNTTVVVQVPEGCTIPTSGGVSAVVYSSNKVPYGFVADKNKWRLASNQRTSTATTSNATYGAYNSGGYQLVVPVGAWDVGQKSGVYYNSTSTAVYFNISPTALTGLTAATGNNASPFGILIQSPSAATLATAGYISVPQTVTSASTYVMYTLGATTGAGISGDTGTAEIFAELANL